MLDVGCRSGALTQYYVAGNTVVGLDVDEVALAHAARRGLATVAADANGPLPFPDASFDVVVAAEVIEHLRDPERFVAEAWRVLQPGGTFTGSVPNTFRLKNRLRFLAGRHPEPNQLHRQVFHPDDLLRLLGCFEGARLQFVAGRFVRLHRRLFANAIVFSARKAA